MVKNVVESEQYSWQGIDFKEEKQKPSQMGILCIKSKALVIKRLSLSLITWQKIECGCSRIWRSKSPSMGEWHDSWPRDKVDYNVFGFPKEKRKGTTRRWAADCPEEPAHCPQTRGLQPVEKYESFLSSHWYLLHMSTISREIMWDVNIGQILLDLQPLSNLKYPETNMAGRQGALELLNYWLSEVLQSLVPLCLKWNAIRTGGSQGWLIRL